MSSSSPTTVISAAAPRIPRISVVAGSSSEPADQHPGEDRETAEQRRGLRRQPALLHRIERADAAREPRDERRDGRRQRQASTKAISARSSMAYARGSQGNTSMMFDAPAVLPALLTPFDDDGEVDDGRAARPRRAS